MNKNVNTNSIAQANEAVGKTADRLSKGTRRMTKSWVVILLLVAGLTLPTLSAFSYSGKGQVVRDHRTKAGTAKAPHAAPIEKRQSDAQRAIQNGILGRIAAVSSNTLKKFPVASRLNNANPRERIYQEKGRKLLEAGKSAARWNTTQLINFANQLEQYEVEAGANTARTRQEKCGEAKERCRLRCDINDAGYFCYFDCRLEYAACLILGGEAVATRY